MSSTVWIILAGAFMTYLTRVGGHIIISRFEYIHPRIQAGLDAVPAAVLTTIVAPAVYNGGPAEWGAIIIAGLAGLYLSLLPMVIIGTSALILARAFLGV
ncbi:MAG: AzlD family protein [Cohaesibacter sp.]|nr:AzlD family protein [Cohaesibacter sp.]MCV6602459.1 AzlD family protein [Cohaesibacter sp.]